MDARQLWADLKAAGHETLWFDQVENWIGQLTSLLLNKDGKEIAYREHQHEPYNWQLSSPWDSMTVPGLPLGLHDMEVGDTGHEFAIFLCLIDSKPTGLIPPP